MTEHLLSPVNHEKAMLNDLSSPEYRWRRLVLRAVLMILQQETSSVLRQSGLNMHKLLKLPAQATSSTSSTATPAVKAQPPVKAPPVTAPPVKAPPVKAPPLKPNIPVVVMSTYDPTTEWLGYRTRLICVCIPFGISFGNRDQIMVATFGVVRRNMAPDAASSFGRTSSTHG